MQEYYEELWEGLEEDLSPPDFERRREFLLSGISPGERVLDLGCGAGDFTAVIERAGAHPVGVEVARAALERARRRYPGLTFLLAPIEGPLPAEDNSFAVVWSSEVIEHVTDTARWLSEIRRVLSPRGRLLLTTPSHGRLLIALYGIDRFSEPLGDHLHLYSRRSLAATLHALGFEEIDVRAAAGPPLFKRTLMARASR
jgi:ubiquinone/menaquinone biosynthesis C-methylase UbiE